jgi:hypothetical protein
MLEHFDCYFFAFLTILNMQLLPSRKARYFGKLRNRDQNL